MSPEPARIVCLVDGDDGESHFVESFVEMTAPDFGPPAAPLEVSAAQVTG